MRNTFRHGDTMIAVESQPATIAFDDLLAATRVIDDTDNGEAPWENWTGGSTLPSRPMLSTMPTCAKCRVTPAHGTGASVTLSPCPPGIPMGSTATPASAALPAKWPPSACRCPPANHRAACQLV